MSFSSAQATANRAAKQAKNYIDHASQDLSAAGYKLARQAQNAYPQLAQNMRGAANRGVQQSKKALRTASHDLREAGHGVLHSAHCAEKIVLKFGLGYVLVKLFKSPEVADVTHKVKAHIEEKPVESALIALGVGYVLGKILR